MYQHKLTYIQQGSATATAGALLLLHGRGASAEDIVRLGPALGAEKLLVYAPQATNSSWYPYSFMEEEAANEPALSSALEVIDELVGLIIASGTPRERIIIAGFSQGACLSLEYAARQAGRYAGVIAFTGGLIGKSLMPERYTSNFAGTPVLMSTGDPDPHVPLTRVEASKEILEERGASVSLKVYKGRQHTISPAELKDAREFVEKCLSGMS